ncbi:hypothetical protein SLS58_002050 [Diplodia intermedia]|uniref:Uncharacterized protein n=1 Tax=Diplodia intermedia TaxID=856260 RepID=A0ABR3U0K6_9PEZI
MSQRIVTKIQLLNHHDKPRQQQQQQQQQKARPLNPTSLRRPHHQTWTLFKELPLIDAARNPNQRPRYSSEVNAVVQVHASLRNKMLPPGPLDGSAELIYMTNIARSNAPGQSPDREKDTDELMFLLEHRPDTIRFWIDERPVGHPSVSKEIRRGVLDDSRNCSVIKVCLNGGREGRPAADGPSPPKESDIYLPPSTRAARVWIYLDPSKRPVGPSRGNTVTFDPKPSPTSSQQQPEKVSRKLSQTRGKPPPQKQPQPPSAKTSQKPTPTRQASTSYGIPIPTRRSSKKATQRSPLSTNPPTTVSPGPPEPKRAEPGSVDQRRGGAPPPPPSTTRKDPTHQPKKRRSGKPSGTTTGRADPDPTTPSKCRERMGSGSAGDDDDDSEPEHFRNDVLHDISRLMTHSDPFGRFHSSFPETVDSEEEEERRDRFAATSPLGGLPRLGQAQLGKFYKAGRRAQSSVFFEGEEEARSGERRIEVSHVEKPGAKRDFAKPSRIRKLGMTLAGGWLKRANHK